MQPSPPSRPCALTRAGGSDSEDTRAVDYDRDPVCALCGRRFARKADLMRHVAVHIHTQGEGGSESGDNNSAPGISRLATRDCSVRLERCARTAAAARAALPGAAYQCDTCGRTCTRKHLLIRHIKEHLRDEADVLVLNKSRTNVRSDTSVSSRKVNVRGHAKKEICEICQKTYASFNNLQRHKRIHSGEKPYSCEICKRDFTRRDGLRRHSKIHTAKPKDKTLFRNAVKTSKVRKISKSLRKYPCEICEKFFVSYTALDTHIRVHSREKPYSCEVCNAKFTQAGDLKSHWLIHTGEKPYCCEVCKKSFRKVSDLNRHKRLHSGEKPYCCEVCKKEFTRMEHLTVHRRIHTGERPYTCDICSKRFPYTNTLKKHKQRHKITINESSTKEIPPCRMIICKEKIFVEK